MKKIINNFILASKSPRRKELLNKLGYQFDIICPNICETDDPESNSLNKAKAIAKNNVDKIVLAADTIVILNNEILGKPKNEKQALEHLLKLNNKSHIVITSFCVLKNIVNKDIIYEHKSVKTNVIFGSFSKDFFIRYIKTKEPFDKAGAYGIQKFGSILVKEIIGSYTNVVGLPLYEVSIALNKCGIEPLNGLNT